MWAAAPLVTAQMNIRAGSGVETQTSRHTLISTRTRREHLLALNLLDLGFRLESRSGSTAPILVYYRQR